MVQLRDREARLRCDERMPVAVAADPAREREESPLTPESGVCRLQLRVEGGVEIDGRLEDGPLEKEQRVLRFVDRSHPAFADLFGQPERLQDLVRRIHAGAQADQVVQGGTAPGLRRMGGEHRLDLQQVETRLDTGRGHVRLLQFPEEPCRRLGRMGRRLEVPYARALLAEVGQLEEKAEGMRHLVGILDGQRRGRARQRAGVLAAPVPPAAPRPDPGLPATRTAPSPPSTPRPARSTRHGRPARPAGSRARADGSSPSSRSPGGEGRTPRPAG